jgi:hypothetical protein
MRRRDVVLRDPSQVTIPAGSTVQLRVATGADRADIETAEQGASQMRSQSGLFTADIILKDDGYIAIETRSASGNPTDRRMIAVDIVQDAPPSVRFTRPGRDLHISDSAATVRVELTATDDIALASLFLRYTRVSGSGEQFSFTEGSLPLSITRSNPKEWRATADIALAGFTLNKGDMLVYRAAASDQGHTQPTLSDAFIIEINAPGSIPMSGFAADDGSDRYALSQEMVIQKTQQLIRSAPSMTADSARDAAMQLAAEQRAVRAEFVFMMGGELAEEVIDAAAQSELHEEAEAEGESDLAAGRGVNKSRLALVDAIRAMSQANASLTAVDLARALAAEKQALASLQAAFSHTRYILRGLTRHERLDDARRLTGDLSAAAGRSASPVTSDEPAELRALRFIVARLVALAGEPRLDATVSKAAAQIGGELVRIAPADAAFVDAAAQINDASALLIKRDTTGARSKLSRAASAAVALLRRRIPTSSSPVLPRGLERLDGALNDGIRRQR